MSGHFKDFTGLDVAFGVEHGAVTVTVGETQARLDPAGQDLFSRLYFGAVREADGEPAAAGEMAWPALAA